MKAVALICLILVSSFNLSATLNIRKHRDVDQISTLDKLKRLAQKNNVAATFISTLELSLTSGGKVDEVIQFVQEALSKAQSDHGNLTVEGKTEINKIQAEIDGYIAELEKMNLGIQETTGNIELLEGSIEDLEKRIEKLRGDLTSLSDRESNIRTAEENDQIAFTQRQTRDANAIGALEDIITALSELRNNGDSFLQKSQKQIERALKKVPRENHIQALVQVSTSFSSEKLGFVIDKLAKILESVEASKANDEQKQAESSAKFTILIAEIDSLRSARSAELKTAKGEKNSKETELEQAEARLVQLKANIESTTKLRDTASDLKDSTTEIYQRKIKDAKEAADALQDAFDILTEGRDSLNEQEGDSEAIAAGEGNLTE